MVPSTASPRRGERGTRGGSKWWGIGGGGRGADSRGRAWEGEGQGKGADCRVPEGGGKGVDDGARDMQVWDLQAQGAWAETGQGCQSKGAPLRVPGQKGDQAGMGCPPKERGGAARGHAPFLQTVHLAWHAYLITHPQHRGPHKCIGVYLLQR